MGLDKTEEERQNIENRKLLPFVYYWDFITKNINGDTFGKEKSIDSRAMDVGNKKCFKALAKTIQNFSGIHK